MSIYTRGGDLGSTSLYGGERVSKATLRIELSGTIDELSSALGVARQFCSDDLKPQIESIQCTLMIMGGEISTVSLDSYGNPITQQQVVELEDLIDRYTKELKPCNGFIIPGQTIAGAFMHVARTVCRRAERVAVALHEQEPLSPLVLAYINRLSDLLFIYAAMQESLPGDIL